MAHKFPEAGGAPIGEAGTSITVDQFIALNDELAAVVRAGLPLEKSLRDLGRDMPGNLGATLQLVATRLSHGESLPQAVDAEQHRFPGVYRAVVQAGLRCGRLAAALEGLVSYARSYAEVRRAIGLALFYPLIVLTLAYGLFVFLVLEIAPKLLAAYEFFWLPKLRILEVLTWCRSSLLYWGPIVPVVLAATGVWWLQSRRVRMLEPNWSRRVLGWLPWVRGILANERSACFAELLALLVEHDVPLPAAIVLAAEATADRKMCEEAAEAAAALERGESLPSAVHGASTFTPMLRWLMLSGLEHSVLSKSLRHAATTYRELSIYNSMVMRQLLPLALLLAIGGLAGFAYCLSVFVPFTSFMVELSLQG